jgi:CelD/BcsL family acetyltransferase involved in cellulose biosynthesis
MNALGATQALVPASHDIEASVVDSLSAFTALRGEWNALLDASGSASPFLTWEWLHTWWRHMRGSSRLRIAAVRADGELIAVAPFRVARGPAHLRCLDMLGTGIVGSDYLDVIVRPGWEPDALAALEDLVGARNLTVRLTHLGPSAMAAPLAQRLAERGWTQTVAAGGTCPYIPLAGHTWDSYLATLGASHRANVRRRIRALQQRFDVRFEQVVTHDQRIEALDRLIAYHERRFDRQGTAFGTAMACAFHDELTARALDDGWLRMYILRVDGAPAAVMYGFLYDRTFYFYQHGFDDQYQQHSIGLVLMALSIRAAIDERSDEFDLLWGTEPYKFLWARHTRELRNIHLFPPNLAGRAHRHLLLARRRAGSLWSAIRVRHPEAVSRTHVA